MYDFADPAHTTPWSVGWLYMSQVGVMSSYGMDVIELNMC